MHRGVCSNYLCDLKVGDTIQMTGPSGTAMVRGHSCACLEKKHGPVSHATAGQAQLQLPWARHLAMLSAVACKPHRPCVFSLLRRPGS